MAGGFVDVTRGLVGVVAAVFALTATLPIRAQEAPPADRPEQPAPMGAPKTSNLKSVISQSLMLLMFEHSMRIAFQEKTRQELDGPFFKDYQRSVKMPTTWADGDGWLVNYVGHPIHGAASGFIFRDTFGSASSQQFGASRAYWTSLGKSSAWIAGYSLQFEIGPISEASIGNVGMHPGTTGWVDHVVTPAVGVGMMAAEDALDKHFLARIEPRIRCEACRAALRIIFNPARSLANMAAGRMPWYRVDRPSP
jgi:hypothetical protein